MNEPIALRSVDFALISRIAARTVPLLWRDGTFLRASTDDPTGIRPTVTFRCCEILISAAEVAPELFDEKVQLVMDGAASMVLATGPDEALKSSDLNYPPFTLGLLALATARVAGSSLAVATTARPRVQPLIERVLDELPSRDGLDAVHPFVQEHILRAVTAAKPHLSGRTLSRVKRLRSRIMASAARQADQLIAKHHMAIITPGESVALAFCAAVLSSASTVREDRVALAALQAAVAAQDPAGSWPLGRVVRTEPSRLEISTYEVAWVVAVTLSQLLPRLPLSSEPAITTIADAASQAAMFADRSLINLDPMSGWASDHPYQTPRIESWTTAIALQFALAGEELQREIQNRAILGTFTSISPHDERWPPWLRWRKLQATGDPESTVSIYDYLDRHVVNPILTHPRRLPSGERQTASVLLFGPPGTSKTTIVQAVADALGWPIVFLSPGTFIAHGLEAIEAAAQSVFERLQRLRRVVVIFDECDELFRDRTPAGQTEPTRNISAFVTASMLPKLQELHDRGEVLFFVCTNHVRMMDPAVTRAGRIDHRIGVGPPDADARARILQELIAKQNMAYLDAAREELARVTERFGRSELKRAAEKLIRAGPWSSAKKARDAASAIAQSLDASLTITTTVFEAYKEDRASISDPYLEGAQ